MVRANIPCLIINMMRGRSKKADFRVRSFLRLPRWRWCGESLGIRSNTRFLRLFVRSWIAKKYSKAQKTFASDLYTAGARLIHRVETNHCWECLRAAPCNAVQRGSSASRVSTSFLYLGASNPWIWQIRLFWELYTRWCVSARIIGSFSPTLMPFVGVELVWLSYRCLSDYEIIEL